MNNQKTSYLKAGFWYVIGNILIKGVSFIALPIFTRLLSPDDFGRYNIFMSYESIMAIVVGLGFSGTIKIAFFDFKDKFLDYLSSVFFLTFIFTLFLDAILTFSFYLFLKDLLPSMWTPGLVNLLVFASLGTAIYNLISAKYVICAEYKANLSISFIYTIANVALSILLCFSIFETQRYLARIIGYTLPIMIIAYGIAIIYIIKSKVIVNLKYWKYAIQLGSPIIIHSLSMILLMQIGKIMINSMCGDYETGIYSVGATISAVLSIVMGSFDNAWAPWFYRGLDEGKYESLVKGNNKLVVVFAAICCWFLLLSPEMIMMLTTREYYDGLYSLVPFILATFINFMYLFAVNQEYYYKKTKTIAIGTVVATISGIILNYLLIPLFGYISAAYVGCISNMILFSIHTIIVYRWGKPRVVSMANMFICLLIISLIGIVTISFRDNGLLRYLIILLITIPLLRYAFDYYKFKKL